MEKEFIRYENEKLPINIQNIYIQENSLYRGLHSHMAIEIIIVKSGILNCSINGETICVQSQQTVLINSNIVHKLSSKNAEIMYMQIDISSYIDNNYHNEFIALYEFVLISKSKPYLLLSDNQEINGILQKINTKYHDHQECNSWYLKAYIYELIAFMHSHAMINPPTSFTTQIQKIKSIVRYLNDNFKSPIKLEDICAATGHNTFSVCHQFKVATGRTVFEYINFLRTYYAIEKLKQNNETILEIAIESGFSSAAYFSRVFKNIMGCAPSEYKRYL